MTRCTAHTAARLVALTAAALVATNSLTISATGAVSASPGSVRTSLPVDGLGADGRLAAYSAGCGELHIWSPATDSPKRVPREVVDCSSTGSYRDVAIASDKVVWVALEEHNHLYLGVQVVPASTPAAVSSLYDSIDEDIGDLAADGAVAAFSTQAGDYAVPGPRATLWAGTTSRVSPLARAVGWMDHVDVEGDVIALGYRDGRARLFHLSGKRIGAFAAGTAVGGLELDEGRLVTLANGRLSVRTLSGHNVLSRRVRGEGPAQLLDASRGLIVYRSGSTLRLVRLADGRDVAIRAPQTPAEHLHARFGELGLVVAHLAVPSQPRRGGVVRLLTNAALERLLARAP